MTVETDALSGTDDRMQNILETLGQLAGDQRRVNILLTRIVHDQDQRLKMLEDGSVGGGRSGGLVGDAAEKTTTQLEIGKDVPAYPLSDLEFLKKSEVFGRLSDDALRVLYYKGEIKKVPKGGTLNAIGDKANSLYVIKNGVVEVARPVDDPNEMKTVAYFTNSDTVGEMRIITESPHRSQLRVPGGAEVFVLKRERLVELMHIVPEFSMLFIEMYAHKLEGTVSTLRTHEQRQRQLEGNLEYFDLATVIQTLLSTDQRTGILHVNDSKQETIAELFIDEGTVKRCRMGILSGEDAFYQLFQADLDRGTFFFKEDIEVDNEAAEMELPGMSLLMEAARLTDELTDIKTNIVPDPNKVYKLSGEQLEIPEDEELSEDDQLLMQTVWNSIGKGMSVQTMVDELPRNEYSVYHALSQLVSAKQIK